jgi:hypothetical protein|tara:strand:- start:2467 stop:3663 length:1197 start_codon:yes stop_codon:yes gene_type:complete
MITKNIVQKKIWKLDLELYQYYKTTDPNAKLSKSDLSFELFGYYLDKNDEDLHYNRRNKDILNELTTRDIDWEKINTIYRYPHLALSRDKMIALKDKYNIKVIRDSSKADISVVSEKTFENLILHNHYGKTYTKQLFLNKMEQGFRNLLNPDAIIAMEDCLDMMNDDDYVYMNSSYGSWNNSSQFMKSPLEYIVRDTSDPTSLFHGAESGLTYVNNTMWASYNSIVRSKNILVSDIYVNEVCSEDSVTLNWELYNNIDAMLQATMDDRNVAMVMMSNCNIETSKTALGLIFFHHGELMKSSKTWNQVAFKTLRKQFDHYSISGWNSGHTSTYSSLTQKLIEDDSLNENAMEHICDLVFQKVITNSIGMGLENSVFEMKRSDMRLKPEFINKLKKEYAL